jgi:hypothetical protein
MIAPLVYNKKRVGVGFMPGSRLGYMPGSRLGLGYMPGARLGDFSPSVENAAVDAGIQPSDIDLLNNLGATDQDLQNLINGNVTLAQLYANYGATIPVQSPAHPATPETPSASAGQIPPGSTILYTATVNTPPLTSAQNIIDAISALLPSHKMARISSAVSASGSVYGPASFSMTVMDSAGNAFESDAHGVLDGLIRNFLGSGNLQLQSSLTVVSPGTNAGGVTTFPGGVPISSAPASSFMTAQSVFPGITNEVLVFGALAVGVLFMFKGRR